VGRVYALPPDTTKGELLPIGRVYTHTGQELTSLSRVEFDHDTNRGVATVTMALRTADKNLIQDITTGKAATATFRTWVQMIPRGQQPLCAPADDLIQNPLYKGPEDEQVVLWSEFQANAAAMKQAAEQMAGVE
jgi:hypothetical protein